jgi:TolB-like protein
MYLNMKFIKLSFCVFVFFFSGCSSTIQYVPVAKDLNLNKDEVRIILNRKKYDIGQAIKFKIYDNNKKIGDIASGGKLVWDRKAGDITLKRYWNNILYFPAKNHNLFFRAKAGYSYSIDIDWFNGFSQIPEENKLLKIDTSENQMPLLGNDGSKKTSSFTDFRIKNQDLLYRGSTIAIFDFENNGLKKEHVRQLSNRLESEIVKIGGAKVVERTKIDEIFKEQKLQYSGCVEECLIETGKMLGANYIVLGSIGYMSNIFTISAKLVNVETGELMQSADYDADNGLGQLLKFGLKQIAFELITGK